LGPDHLSSAVTDLMDSTSTILLSAAADVANNNNKDLGWWETYINLFKSSLLFVHRTIDGPLRSVGIEQTWGPSIAVFTACTYM
jgi:YidC/Oxa1 family membrane protein insertase